MVTEKHSKIDRLFGRKIWLQFAVKSIILIVMYILLLPLLVNFSGAILEGIGNSYYERFQNDGSSHKVKIVRKNLNQDFNVMTHFYEKATDDGGHAIKELEINIRNEVLNPIAVFLIIFLSFPFGERFRLKSFSIALTIILVFIAFKLFAMVYDNYNMPDYVLKDLVFLLDYPVYLFNMALASLGTSINYAFPAIVALIANYIFIEEIFITKLDLDNKMLNQ